jgi:hypothetical protein
VAGKHSRKQSKDDFCAVAAEGKCGCASGNKDYREECKPSPPWKPSFDFQWNNVKNGPRQQSYAPHHIVCVASVGTLIVEATDQKVDGVVRATAWCVNTERNMVAMPLWGHTVKWYCNLDEEEVNAAVPNAPDFQNVPQHDWDHTGTGCYIEELNKEIIKLVNAIAEKGHEAVEGDLAGSLNDMSDDFRGRLEQRGMRGSPKGTHEGWKRGMADPQSDWYLPFSMAIKSAASRKGMPKLSFTTMVKNKIQWLVNQL